MKSLDIILGERPTPPENTPKSPVALELEDMGRKVAGAIATRNWDDPVFDHFAPNFKAYIEHSDVPVAKSVKEYQEVYNAIAAAHPDYSNEVLSINADVDEKRGRASVWVLMRVYGHPKGTVRESVTVAHLERKEGIWLFTRQHGIRGINQMGD